MKTIVKVGRDSFSEEGPESLPILYNTFTINPDLEDDLLHWLEWAEKMRKNEEKVK